MRDETLTNGSCTVGALGAVVSTDFVLEELPLSAGRPSMSIQRHDGPIAERGQLLREIRDRDGQLRSALYEDDDVLFWCTRGVGIFQVARTGDDVRYTLEPGATQADIRTAFLGPVLGLSARLRGETLLHGAAFTASDYALAVTAPHGYGKSTLAATFARDGFPLLAEDIVHIVDADGTATVEPYAPRIKLWADSLEHLGDDPERFDRTVSWLDKRSVTPQEVVGVVESTPRPLRVIYLLEPHLDPEQPICISPVDELNATMRLHASMYLAEVDLRAARMAELDRAAWIANNVAVRVASYCRTFDQLSDLRAALLDDAAQLP